jgi:hypothetical protein
MKFNNTLSVQQVKLLLDERGVMNILAEGVQTVRDCTGLKRKFLICSVGI